MKRPTEEQRQEIERSVPSFRLRAQAVYEALAEEARKTGLECSWVDIRLADMKQHFPSADDVRDLAAVRTVHLWYLAYQRQLVADLDSPVLEVRLAAAREIERVATIRERAPKIQA